MIALAALMAICSVRIEPITIDVATVQTASGYAVTRVIRRDGVQPDVFFAIPHHDKLPNG